MDRRAFIVLVSGLLAARHAVEAQQPGKIPKIGVLWHAGSAEEEEPYFAALLAGFKDLGYVEGRNIAFLHRFPNEVPERFERMAAELVSLNIDALVSVGSVAPSYAKRATKTVPVVFILVADPVGAQLVESLSRPGGNMTGLSNFSRDLIGKRLQILKETIPRLSRIAQLVNPNAPPSRLYIEVTRAVATELDLDVLTFEARAVDELGAAFDSMMRAGVQAVTVNPDGFAFQGRVLIARLALARHLPLVAYSRDTFEVGALMSYGADHRAICRRGAVYVDKILKGAKPGELPVEGPTRFEFLINLKTAKALGLTIPQALLLRADQVIE